MIQLTQGAISKLMNGIDVEDPVLQYLGHKLLGSPSGITKYRLMLTDGTETSPYAMLEPSLNYKITNNVLSNYSILKITSYNCTKINCNGSQRSIIVVRDFEVVQDGKEVGKSLKKEGSDAQASAAPARPAAAPLTRNVSANSLNSSMMSGSVPVTPIAALSPYQNRWIIKVRVTNKSEKRSWNNPKGEGTLFSMDLLDESGEIRCTAFREMCEKYYDMIEIGKVYYISRCTLKTANKQFSNLKNDYELTMSNDSEIVLCDEGEGDIPTLKFEFQPISDIENKEKNDLMDVLGVVKSTGDLVTLTARTTGRELKKRDVNIVDESNTMVILTLWGKQAEDFNGENHPIVAIKGAKIGEFQGGKNLSIVQSSLMQIDPDVPEAHRLRGWYSTVGEREESRFISKTAGGAGSMNGPWLTFREAKDQRLGQQEGADVYIVKATITFIRNENILYKSCPAEACKKKVVDLSNQMYRCEKCDKEYPNFMYRMLANVSLADWSGNQWAGSFNEEAEKILSISAQELGEMKDNDNDLFLATVGEATFKSFIFKLRVRLETYNDESRLKTTIAGVQPLNYKVYNSHLLSKLKELTNIGRA